MCIVKKAIYSKSRFRAKIDWAIDVNDEIVWLSSNYRGPTRKVGACLILLTQTQSFGDA